MRSWKKSYNKAFLFAAILVMLSSVNSVDAHQLVCFPDRSVIVKTLRERYLEVPVGRGLGSDGNLVELFRSLSNTWTLVLTTPSGASCIFYAGKMWGKITGPVDPGMPL